MMNGLAALGGAAALFLRWTAGGMAPVIARRAIVAGLGFGITGAFLVGRTMAEFGNNATHGGLPLVFSEVGLLLGGALGVIVVLARAGLPIMVWADRAVVVVTVAQAFSRLGCAAAGCCWGRPAQGLLAVNLPDITGSMCPRYPTQAAMVAFHVVMIPILLGVESRWRDRAGATASLYVLAFFAVRFLQEPFRGDVQPLVWGLTPTQFVAVPLAATAALVLVRALRCPPDGN